MKAILLLVLLGSLMVACTDKESQSNNESLIGTWKLNAVLMDPGDGSGTFQAVSSAKVLMFDEDGTLHSNGSICSLSVDLTQGSDGTYSLADSSIQSASCAYPELKLHFEQSGRTLVIDYFCIEACKARYMKQ